MVGLTGKEHNKLTEVMRRLGRNPSPVLRQQAILQFSQIVDILELGATDAERELQLIEQVDELQNKLDELVEC